MGLTVAGTGHRPGRLGLGYDSGSRRRLFGFAVGVLEATPGVTAVISGGAQGWDQALAAAAVRLRLPVTVAVPFAGQEGKWPPEARTFYHFLLGRAERVVTVCTGGYAAWKFLERDRWMVDHADHVLALLDDGRQGSGTRATVEYALSRGVAVTNVWAAWVGRS